MRQLFRSICILLLCGITQVNAQTQVFNRDASFTVGGFGTINSAVKVTTKSGINETAYEWGFLSILNNYSKAGENVAIYGQSNALGLGPTWGMVSEVADDAGRPGAMVGHEITMNMSGPDSGLRLGLDVVLADGKYWRGKGSSDVVEGTIGVRVAGQDSATSLKTWGLGYEAKNFRIGGLHLQGVTTVSRPVPDGIIYTGTLDALINTYGSSYNYFMRIPGSTPAFQLKHVGGYVGRLQLLIDGNPYYIPIYSGY